MILKSHPFWHFLLVFGLDASLAFANFWRYDSLWFSGKSNISLQYQTDIQGGRPQFLYDTCYLSHPSITTYWKLETSNVEFSGDRIGVYFSFIYGSFQDHAWVYFYPN